MSRPPETLADYVLGALSAAETRALEAHLETCPGCRREVRRLQGAFYALPDALPQQALPEDAWEKLQARRKVPRRYTGPRTERWAAAAVFLVLLAGSLGWGLDRNQAFRRLEAEQQVLTAWMNNPELVIRPLEPLGGAFSGILCTYPDGRALLVQKETPPRGTAYEVWGLIAGDRTALGTTTGRVLRLRSGGYDAIEVSLEPLREGAREGPTQLVGRVSL
ncbi:MAG: hypothetical protein AVDCRST_MAG86-2253 [uncultured Truepera sp.]|uniref:Putative zinc-finger domain-containing protein n=1 Tax=uncultured Truepera sp. TaxID=543023 RepID=A0A6J4VDG8_9DEIN|nr:MAG: hypothetical protein AVDCRST_MAG86-2253 [uncultured Truepera sp.]